LGEFFPKRSAGDAVDYVGWFQTIIPAIKDGV